MSRVGTCNGVLTAGLKIELDKEVKTYVSCVLMTDIETCFSYRFTCRELLMQNIKLGM